MKIVIVDLDGTVFTVGDRIKHIKKEPQDWDAFYLGCDKDEPVQSIVRLVMDFLDLGYEIVFCTGRDEICRKQTEKAIKKAFPRDFEYEELLMRKRKDDRDDTKVKPELIAHIEKDSIAYILEDRNSMVAKWRDLGFTVLQVADGKF